MRTENGLVRLDELGGDTDLSGYYNKQEIDQQRALVDAQLLFKQHVVSSTPGAAGSTEVWDTATNMVRRLVEGKGVTLSIDANGNIVIDSTGSG